MNSLWKWLMAHEDLLKWAVGLTVTACLGGAAFSSHMATVYKEKADGQFAEAAKLKEQGALLQAQIDKLTQSISTQQTTNDLMSKNYAIVLGLLAKAPPKAAPAPADASQLARDLGAYGLTRPTVGTSAYSQLPTSDATLVWNWHAEWARMPQMEKALSTTQAAQQDCDKLQAGLKVQVGNYATEVGQLNTRYDLKVKEDGATIAGLKDSNLSLKYTTGKWKLYFVVGVPLAAYTGYKLGHH